MKIYASALALCAFQASAFVHPPLSQSSRGSAVHAGRSFDYSSDSRTRSSENTRSVERIQSRNERPSTSQINRDGQFNDRYSQVNQVWERSTKVMVQGGTLKTYAFPSPAIERVQVVLKTEGRPLDADVELWQGPDNNPHKMRVYVEDGSIRPFSAIFETPRGPNTVAIRNIGNMEFPFAAGVVAESSMSGSGAVSRPTFTNEEMRSARTIQGGALRTYPFDPYVESIQVLLRTDGYPLNAKIELLQGPNNNKQVVEVYTEDGMDRPFFMILATPGVGNVVRIVNTSPVTFPLTASVEAYEMGDPRADLDPVLGGDIGR